MNFLKSLWRKLFKTKTGVYETFETDNLQDVFRPGGLIFAGEKKKYASLKAFVYDPAQDPMKIMSGEIESYFE